jgi:hypothetical protein
MNRYAMFMNRGFSIDLAKALADLKNRGARTAAIHVARGGPAPSRNWCGVSTANSRRQIKIWANMTRVLRCAAYSHGRISCRRPKLQ